MAETLATSPESAKYPDVEFLYYPEHLLVDKLQPYKIPHLFFYYTTDKDANYWVNIDSTLEKKIEAASKHVSQFPPSFNNYRPDWEPGALEKLKQGYRATHEKKTDTAWNRTGTQRASTRSEEVHAVTVPDVSLCVTMPGNEDARSEVGS